MVGPGIEELPPESGSEKGRLQGAVRLSGQLTSDTSLREVLHQVRGLSDDCGLLRILSKNIRGYIGITSSSVISGAHVTSTREYGLTALRKLLAANKGIFVVMAMSDHPIELRQNLKLSLDDLLAFRNPDGSATLSDALLFFETQHSELFMVDKAAQDAATTGGDLAEFESYMAWGGEAPVLANNLAKLTGNFGKAQNVQPAQPVPPPVEPAPPEPPAQPAAPQAWPEDLSRKAVAQAPVQAPAAQPPEPLQPLQPASPGLKLTSSRSKPDRPPRGDDEQSISQKISKLREEQTASQKLDVEDLDIDDSRPVNLSPAERRKHEIIQIATWVAGIGLFFALGQQVFNTLQATSSYQSGVQALKNADYARAQVDLSHALQYGAGPRAFLYRAIAESRLGHRDESIADFDRLIASDSKDSLARAGKAALLIKGKQYTDAINLCDEILKYDRDYGDAYRLKALANCAMGNYKEAIDDATACENAKISKKGLAEALSCRAFALFKVKRFEDSLSDYTQAVELDPGNSQLYSSRALVYKKLGQWKSALADTREAIRLDPSNPGLYKLRAECYRNTGDAAKAAADLDTAAKLKPSLDSFRLRASARMAAKDYKGAMEDYEYILSVEPDNKSAKAGYESAKGALYDGKPLALADVAKDATTKPAPIVIKGTPAELTSKGYTALNAGRSGDAITLLSAAVKGKPNDAQARRYLAYAFVQAKDFASAASQFAMLTSMGPLSAEDRVMYGKALYRQKRYAEATQMYGTVVAQYPTNDEARQGLINALIDSGARAQAIQQCQEGMARNPAHAKAYTILLKSAQSQPIPEKH